MTTFEVIAGRSVSIAARALAGLFFALAGLFLLTGIALAQPAFPTTPGARLSGEAEYKPSGAHVEELTRSLRRITGFSELHFEKDGSLVTGATQSGGSATARRILTCALRSGSVFIIEDYSGSPSVNFGQLNEGLRGEVRNSFDAGFKTLHELLHGIGYKDAASVDELGECEETLNRARAELGLPLRDQYFGDELQMARQFVSVRLRFRSDKARVSAGSASARTQYLFFVIQSDYEQQTAPIGVAAFDCGNGSDFQRKVAKAKGQRQRGKGAKGQRGKGLKGKYKKLPQLQYIVAMSNSTMSNSICYFESEPPC